MGTNDADKIQNKTISTEPNTEPNTALKADKKSLEAVSIAPLYSADDIALEIDKLAKTIATRDYKNLIIIAVLKGSFVFAADLIRAMHRAGMSPEMDFLSLASYGTKTKSSGEVKIIRDIDSIVEGRSVLLIDDILESGRTLDFAKDLVTKRGAHEVLTCVLLNKDVSRAVDITADFHAFDCPDLFVIGYGMDLAHQYRELPFVGVLSPSD